MEIVSYNREAWNHQSIRGSEWCTPVSSEVIEATRNGNWNVILTPNKIVPKTWFGDIREKDVLCLASGGGQQVPILAAAGAKVTSFDNSDEQLAKDLLVAKRDGLKITTQQGDMADLSIFPNESFDLIFHPVSNVFAESVLPVWKECYRVLKPNGRLLSGFMNSAFFLFDHEEAENTGELVVKYSIPFSDKDDLPSEKLKKIEKEKIDYEFGHTLQDQIGGQTAAGFMIADLYEDDWNEKATPLNNYMKIYLSTLAIKPIAALWEGPST